MNPNGLTHYSVMSPRTPGQRPIAEGSSPGSYTPRVATTPRTSGLRRLDSTRNVRHGSVVIERNEALLSMDPSKDPLRKVHEEGLYLNLTSRSNDIITVEWTYCPAQSWMPIDHFLLEHSSVTNPDFINAKLASNQRQYTLRDCTPGTNNFFVVSAIDVYGKVIQRSKQLTVQSSAPIDRPILKLKKSGPDMITIEWNRPAEYGDGFISEYHLKVNGKFHTNIRSTKTSFDFIECRPMEEFTFRIQALSIKYDCNSEWSNVLEVACPASLPITLERLRPKNINTVKVGWNLPTCIGGARVKEFKVYFKEASTFEMYNDQEKPDPDKIFGHRHATVKTHKPDETVSFIKVEPDKKYWAILRAEISPDGCPPVITRPVRVRATIRPVAPQIKVNVYGELERAEANKEIAKLLDTQDKINRQKMLTQNSEIVMGAQLKNDEIQDMNVKLYQIETRLQELVKVVNKLTGFVPIVLSWEKPEFDEFSEPLSYRINVDDHSYQDPLPLETTQHSLKLDVEKLGHRISINTLSWHPVGHSEESNVELVEAKQFRPNRFFCYFTSHNKAASWPSKGGCRLEDFLAHEKKLTSKHNVHRGLLKTRVAPKPFRVMGVHDATWQQLIRHFGAKKPTIILFWTKWCMSSQSMLERFCVYAHRLKDKYQYLACCVKSGEDILTHRKSIIELLNEKNLRVLGNIRHCCGCHLAPDLPNNTVEKMENASIPASFDLAGVPTFCILDIKGRLSWQGRIAADTDETFFIAMSHIMAQVEEQECPNMEYELCKNESGMLHNVKQEDNEDQEEAANQGGDVNENNVISQSEENSKKSHDQFSLDEFHLLHSRLHGKALEEVERTQDEQYAKVSSLSPRKEWLERRRANAKKAAEESEKQPETHRVRFGEVNQDPPKTASSQSTSEKRPGIKNYQYRQPHREYRSPHNGYEKSRHGYGASGGSTWRDQPPVAKSSVPNVSEHKPENGRKNGYKYSSVNYHLSERVGGDGEPEPDVVDSGHTRNRPTALGYQKNGTGKWNSQIKASNVTIDTTRGSSLSSTQHSYQEEEIYEFMIPDNMRNKNNFGSKPTGKTTKPEPYIYRRPSTLDPINDPNSPPKSPKKKDKYSHIQSRYSKDIYQPGNAKQRYVISAHHKKGRRGQTNNATQNGKQYNNYTRQAYV